MQASEGRLGRVFMIRLEAGEAPGETIERFAAEKGVLIAQVFALADTALAGILAPNAEGTPRLRFPEAAKVSAEAWVDGEVMLQEVLGVNLRRVLDPASGRETLARASGTQTRVMEKAAPAPEASGPGVIPVYLFNVEFN